MKLRLDSIIAIIVGSAIMGFGINSFNIPNHLAEGGITGISILIKLLFPAIDQGIVFFVLNIPLFFLGWKILGRTSFIYTILGTVSLSVFLSLFENTLPLPMEDRLLASLYAGVAVGVGLGIIFRYGGTTGGVDIIARLLQKYWGVSMGRTLFLGDILVIGASLIYLNLESAMYTLVVVFIAARVIDFFQDGAYAGKALTIISDKAEEISKQILEFGRGVTLLSGKGAFSGAEKQVVYVVISRNEVMRFKNIVQEIDPHAFLIVNDVHEVLGEGFTLDENKKPIHD
ncbi:MULTISPECIES: YitT family protein [Brevibacillus]|uniref:YitT family protein n=1 Tax=Brevibacillus invocatus TaxID=173959 RepID=A0A3M8CHX1_9BACL|nr:MULTISPECIES: YitT family protein [Brevibacillus]MCM3077868.1 YitT family protein [Brevibacillus invocatus]MCM3428058.1 YitT family protein [Brevibacillus invocatus]MDH4616043.1 YitT family protein [Brevibacillus sp. AY1]RNB75322.1 YitT family protein [Brevibacillus invocatus]